MPSSPTSKANGLSPNKLMSTEISIAEAAFLCVRASLAEELETREEFRAALQIAGYNPSKAFLARFWKDKTQGVTYQQFSTVLQTEPLPRKIDLLSYFKKLDPQNQGWISHQTLLEALISHGDDPLSTEFIKTLLLEDQKFNDADRFDYNSFCTYVFDTSAKLVTAAKERAAAAEAEKEFNSRTYKNLGAKLQRNVNDVRHLQQLLYVEGSQLSKFYRRECVLRGLGLNYEDLLFLRLKGAFYFEEESVIGHQYTFTVKKPGRFSISIRSEEGTANPVDCQLYLFKLEGGDKTGSPRSQRQFVARTPIALASSTAQWTGQLPPGAYLLVPSTTGCKLKKRAKQPDSDVKLVARSGDAISLTPSFTRVLTDIFAQVDLDSSGGLDKQEFNLFNWRTSGEEVQDEEWEVVKENLNLCDGELTLGGFLQLHQMEAEDNGGDSAELWITLNAMGYNALLQQDEASVFEVCVQSEKGPAASLEVSGLKAGGNLLDWATIKVIQESSKLKKKIQGMHEVILYREDSGVSTSFVVQNRSSASISLELDFSGSKNVLVNHPYMIFRTSLSPKSTVFVAHLIPDDPVADHEVHLTEKLTRKS